ncbi:sensor histidine kinase [Colwelliaceae bacterium 6441]
MRSQFIRIYILMFAVVCILLYSINTIFQEVNTHTKGYVTSVNDLFSHHKNKNQQPYFLEVPKNSIALPETIEKKLMTGEVIPLEVVEGFWTYYQLQDDHLLTYGPVPADLAEEDIKNYFVLSFYSALALLFLLLLKPLFNDLHSLQKEAKRFGNKPKVINPNIKPRSSIYPLAVSFNQMSRQVVDLLTMNRDLSRTIAHELRTPLSRMRFVVQALHDTIDPVYSKRMEQDIEEVDGLIAAYLNFAKLESQEKVFDKRRRNIAPLMKVVAEKYALYEGEVAITFNYQHVQCHYDAQHLSIAIQNLLNNAMRYAKSQIKVDLTLKNNHCKLTVSDDGPGLANDKLDLFDAFVRKKNDQNDKGFGLGLYIARRVAILHSGDLLVDNDPELGGARFTLIWPN